MEIRQVPIDSLIEYARNPRKNDEVVDKMVACIKEFGFRIPIVAKSDGTVVDGHLRLKAGRKLGLKEVPVVLADDLTETQIKAFRLVANQSANWAEWDEDLLKLELEDLENEGFDVDLIGFDNELSVLDRDDEEIKEDDFDTSTIDDNQPIVTKPGDLWILGEHRLLCGDATNQEDVKRLMNNQLADMVFTDPPYNVAIGDKNKSLQKFQKAGKITENIKNDIFKTDEECGEKLWLPAFQNMLLSANDNCSIYVTMPQGGTHMMMMMMKAGWQVKHELIWVKNSPTFSMGRLDYDYQHEPICFGWNKGHKKIGKGKFNKSIWQIDKPKKCDVHLTMKPLELIENALLNSSENKDNILDLFGGSGSTLIACEQLKRKCFMMELDPKYCDVIIRRWQTMTNQTAVLEASGKSFSEICSK